MRKGEVQVQVLKGYRTLIANGVILLVSVAGFFGVVVDANESTAIAAGALALANIILRFYTSTAWGKSGAPPGE
jgi:hypothetical protein